MFRETDTSADLYARPRGELYVVAAVVISGLLVSIAVRFTGLRSPAALAWVCISVLLGLTLLAILWAAFRARTYRLHGNTLYVWYWWNPSAVRALDTMDLKSAFLGFFPILGLPVLDLGSWGVLGVPGSELVFNDGSTYQIYRHYAGGPAMIRATFSRFGNAVAAKKR